MIDYLISHLWLLWLIIAAVLMTIELLSFDFFVTCFAIGAIGALLGSFLNIPFWAQVLLWAVASTFSVFYIRPVLKRTVGSKHQRQSNADALIGREGRVTEAIPADGHGYVKIDGDLWRSVTTEGEEIEIGTRVRVIDRNSTILTVVPL